MSQVVEILSALCLIGGALFCAIGGLGMVRLPDLYSRTHAATITDTLGAGLVLVGLMLQGGLSNVTVKLALVLFFMYFTSPVAGHALVKAAFSNGMRAKLDRSAPFHRDPTHTVAEAEAAGMVRGVRPAETAAPAGTAPREDDDAS